MKGKVALVFMLIIGLSACRGHTKDLENPEPLEETIEVTISDLDESITSKELKLTMAGDIMFHEQQLAAGFESRRDSYDFYSSFSAIRNQLLVSDYVFANLETTFSGPPYSGYPRFSTPDSGAEALAGSGINFLTTANNHCLDYGLEGITRTLETLDKAGLSHTGTFDNAFSSGLASNNVESSVNNLSINGLNIAVINYTYGLNNYDSNPFKNNINSIDFYDQEAFVDLYSDVEAAEGSEADYVMVFLHFGQEFQVTPDEDQRDLAYNLIDLGADFIIGSHPHLVQPIEVVWEVHGQILEEPKIIVYSLGDFLSSTDILDQEAEDQTSGMLLNLNFEQIDLGAWSLKGLEILPTTCFWQDDQRIIMALDQDSQQYSNAIDHLTQLLEEKTLEQVSLVDGWYEINF